MWTRDNEMNVIGRWSTHSCPRSNCKGALYREQSYYVCVCCGRRFSISEIEVKRQDAPLPLYSKTIGTNETVTETEPQRFFSGDATANYHPMTWDETDPGFNESNDKDLVSEDICAGLEVENTYATYGKTAFKTYEQYRRVAVDKGEPEA